MIHLKRLLMGLVGVALVCLVVLGLMLLAKLFAVYLWTSIGIGALALLSYNLGKDLIP